MNKRFAAPVASAATAILLVGGCSDDGPWTLAMGEVDFDAVRRSPGDTMMRPSQAKPNSTSSPRKSPRMTYC